MGGCHSELKHKGDANSLEDYKITTGSNPSLAEGKEPPSFQDLCARQQELVARSEVLKSAVAQQTRKRSFRSELADIVLKGPRRPVQPSEEGESEVVEDVFSEPGPSTPRVKLSYRRSTLDSSTSPQMKEVVDKYFDTLEELKRFVVSDEIYLDRKAPLAEDKADDRDHYMTKKETAAVAAAGEDKDSAGEKSPAADEKIAVEPTTAEENEAAVDQADSLTPTEGASTEKIEHSVENLEEESTSLQSTPKKGKKKNKSVKVKKSKKVFSCFSSENCE